jgi:fatty acid desaturase
MAPRLAPPSRLSAMQQRLMMRSAFVLVALLGLLILAAVASFWAWQEVGEVAIGLHGWIALGLGVVLTFLVGAGLMALMFFSARRGYDERAQDAERTHADHWREPGDQS